MQVNSQTQAYSINQTRNNSSSPITAELSNATAGKTETDRITISSEGQNAAEKWRAIANKYDVTNMSQSELVTMTMDLNENKMIPESVGLHMLAPPSMNHDPDKKYDVLTGMRDEYEFQKNRGVNPEQLEQQKLVVEILARLNGLHRSDPQS